MIHNSSFRSLDLESGTEALISDCFLNAKDKQRPTLIWVTNAKVSIHNSTFRCFKNIHGAAVLGGRLNSSVTVKNSTFSGNEGQKGSIWLHDTGSIFIADTSAWSNKGLTNCRGNFIRLENNIKGSVINSSFHENEACFGSVIIISNNVDLSVQNSHFRRNHALDSGGVLISEGESILRVDNSTFERNSARQGAVLFLMDKAMTNISDSKFTKNAADEGGAITVENSFLYVNTSHFEENTAGMEGGAIKMSKMSTLRVQDSTFVNNSAGIGGGLFVANGSSISVLNSSFKFGGTLDLAGENTDVVLQNSTFESNIFASGCHNLHLKNIIDLRIANCVFHSHEPSICINSSAIINSMNLWNVSLGTDSESPHLNSNNENFLDEAIASGYLMLEDNGDVEVKETLYASGKS